ESTVRAAVQLAQKKCPGVPLFAGGKSMGGRMTSQAQAKEPLPGVRALVFLGFPLHPAGAPAIARAAHLADVQVPMLFLSGERDKLAELQLLRPVVDKLGARATLELIAEGDHGFDVPKRTGKTHEQILAGLAESMVRFALRIHIDRTE
ncbi:MAG: dienelactone hydrolase family protein, partial [Deltaproteobacteria bacterium]|nr:dienelactone hydrolase family protein [Deltaproteobacteria bacterium]